jgi:tRNA threonylcarbamoyladenosine biosynthesis protein TsaE
VQTYAAGLFDIWHADLYRLTDPQEVEELGLLSAFDEALCLVEWPDRLGPLAPENALWLRLDIPPGAAETRRLHARGSAHLIDALRQTA